MEDELPSVPREMALGAAFLPQSRMASDGGKVRIQRRMTRLMSEE